MEPQAILCPREGSWSHPSHLAAMGQKLLSNKEAWRKEEEALALVHMRDVANLETGREIDFSKSCLVVKIHRTL